MRFGLERNDTLNVANDEIIARGMVCWCKLFHNRTLGKCHVVLVGRDNFMRIFLCCLFDEIEERRFALLSVDDKRTAKDFVAAVLAVDLGKSEHL